MKKRLLFVYNADSGLFNTLTDIAHKILSPNTYACNLCALTHGNFRAKQDWLAFLHRLPADCEFLHRDEFRRAHSGIAVEPPAIFLRDDAGLAPFLSAREIAGCADLAALTARIERRLADTA